MVGPVFNTKPIAMELQLGSPLRKRISALIAFGEDGTNQQIYNKWFGAP